MASLYSNSVWPELPYHDLQPTVETLQLWTQVVGKIRLAKTPWLNHAWHATFYVSARGLTTGLIPHGALAFDLEFDLVSHALLVRVTNGGHARIALTPRSVAGFYAKVLETLTTLGIPVEIDTHPNELPEAIPFPQDHVIRAYDRDAAQRLWRALVQCDRVFNRFRTRFIGKCSPVHMFWGSFDLAVTRFSGRKAPLHPGGIPHLPDSVTREAYSHEVSSAGFWPGSGDITYPAFYSYCYPAPAAFAQAAVLPAQARFNAQLGEFLLPYDAVRAAENPDKTLLSFLQTTYEAAANTGNWDRTAFDVEEGQLGHPRHIG
jgi:hypothetical protein